MQPFKTEYHEIGDIHDSDSQFRLDKSEICCSCKHFEHHLRADADQNTSGSTPSLVLANFQTLAPALQWDSASSELNQIGCSAFDPTIRLTYFLAVGEGWMP